MVSSNRGYPDPENPSEDLSPNDEVIFVADTDTDEEDNPHNDYQPLPTHEIAETSDEEASDEAAAPETLPPITRMEDTLVKEVWTGAPPLDIEMDSVKVDEVKQAMMNFTLPPSSIPDWAREVPEEQWKQQLINRLQHIQKKRAYLGRMMAESDATVEATRRLNVKKQTLDDAYAAPANFLEIDVVNPVTTIGVGKKRFTDYEVKMRTNLPVFKVKESSVRRRYSDFEWLRNELERDSKIVVPPLPGKAWKRQLPFRGDDGIFEEDFIEERRKGLEVFINKIAGHPLAQNERCLHMFLQEPHIDKNYVPGKIRNT